MQSQASPHALDQFIAWMIATVGTVGTVLTIAAMVFLFIVLPILSILAPWFIWRIKRYVQRIHFTQERILDELLILNARERDTQARSKPPEDAERLIQR